MLPPPSVGSRVVVRAALLASLFVPGCNFGEGDAKIPGEELGTYRVVATLGSSSCGPDALGAPDVWEFDVRLSRDDPDLYWLNGEEPVYGTLAADGLSFSFDTETRITLQEPRNGRGGCVIVRSDRASGRLEGSALDVPAFAGELRYGYSARAGSDCTEWLGLEGGFATLPCSIDYDIPAVRTALPDEKSR